MVPDSADADDAPSDVAADGGGAGFDEAALYTVVRAAVKDAILDVVGTVLLVGVAFVLVVAGGQAAVRSVSPAETAAGASVAAAGLYLAAAALELVPPLRDWF